MSAYRSRVRARTRAEDVRAALHKDEEERDEILELGSKTEDVNQQDIARHSLRARPLCYTIQCIKHRHVELTGGMPVRAMR